MLQQMAVQTIVGDPPVWLFPRHVQAVFAPLGEFCHHQRSVLPVIVQLAPPPVSVVPAGHVGLLKLKKAPLAGFWEAVAWVHVSPCSTGAWKYPTMSMTTSVFPAPWLRTVSSFDSRVVELEAVTVPVEIVVPVE